MCHLRKRKVRNVREALQAFFDNDEKPITLDDADDSSDCVGFEGHSEGEVSEEAHIFFDSGSKAIVVAPL